MRTQAPWDTLPEGLLLRVFQLIGSDLESRMTVRAPAAADSAEVLSDCCVITGTRRCVWQLRCAGTGGRRTWSTSLETLPPPSPSGTCYPHT
jgi:membrane-associated PAP2 superfamily phosphatase